MIEVLKQALEEANEALQKAATCIEQLGEENARLRQAIKDHAMHEVQRLGQEIEAEPVAWHVNFGNDDEPNYASLEKPNEPKATIRPLVFGDTSPPQRQWVGLDDEEYKVIHSKNYNYDELAHAIEAKLKEKNT